MPDRRVVGYAAVAALVLAGAGALVWQRVPPPPTDGTHMATGTALVRRTDVTVRERVGGALGYRGAVTLLAAGAGTVTWLPGVGATIRPNQRLYEVDGLPVVLWTGSRPTWRDFAIGMVDGADVTQLERNLTALGFGGGLTVDRHFSGATAAAIRRWQAVSRLPRSGAIQLGRVVFGPGPIRVAAVTVTLGARVAPGTPVLTVTSTVTDVTVNLDPTRQQAVHPGDRVTVSAPDGRHATTGRVAAVGAPVTSTGTGAAPTALVVPVTIWLDHPAEGPGIGPVQVAITTAQHRGVLAVPIEALLAAPGGGYRLAVLDGDRRRLVTVHTGLFDESDGVVEIEGAREGTTVEVPR